MWDNKPAYRHCLGGLKAVQRVLSAIKAVAEKYKAQGDHGITALKPPFTSLAAKHMSEPLTSSELAAAAHYINEEDSVREMRPDPNRVKTNRDSGL